MIMKKQYSAIMLVVMLTVGTAYGGFLSDLFKKGGTAASKVKLDERDRKSVV